MYYDVFSLHKVSPEDVDMFNKAAGMIPVLRGLLAEVSMQIKMLFVLEILPFREMLSMVVVKARARPSYNSC